jgi:hypothetical protein
VSSSSRSRRPRKHSIMSPDSFMFSNLAEPQHSCYRSIRIIPPPSGATAAPSSRPPLPPPSPRPRRS